MLCFSGFELYSRWVPLIFEFESNCLAFFTVFPLFYLLFTFFSLSCFAFLFVCFYFCLFLFYILFSACFQAGKVSKVATLMSSKLKVRKQIDCYDEEKKITLNKTSPYFSFETVKETFAGLRWWSKSPTIGKKSKHSNISHCFVLFVILGRDPFNQNSNRSDREKRTTYLKRCTRFLETFPVGPNRSIEFWTEIS